MSQAMEEPVPHWAASLQGFPGAISGKQEPVRLKERGTFFFPDMSALVQLSVPKENRLTGDLYHPGQIKATGTQTNLPGTQRAGWISKRHAVLGCQSLGKKQRLQPVTGREGLKVCRREDRL